MISTDFSVKFTLHKNAPKISISPLSTIWTILNYGNLADLESSQSNEQPTELEVVVNEERKEP